MSNLFANIAPLQASLDYHMDRHNVLSSNIAHVDTPGYKPSDLARVESTEFANALGVAMERTNPLHMNAGAGSLDQNGMVFEDLSAGAGNDGNYVSLDREAAKLAANHIRFDVVSSVVSAELRSLAFAARDAK
ncbi:MAG: flagellar basal body rod protein FlgB [Myxococcota bacterium]|nr:flagellar basal body rod protein FlgB [Myxococcota bacterium]